MTLIDSTPQTEPQDDLPTALTAEDIFLWCYGNSDGHLSAAKRRQLQTELADKGSFVSRETAARAYIFRHARRLNRESGDPGVADDRALIVQVVRDEAMAGRLSCAAAEQVLAEGGESVDWLDSVPDRLLMQEPIVPITGTPVEKRRLLAERFPVLAECIDHQNRAMCERLAGLAPILADALQDALDSARRGRDRGPGGNPRLGR